jgi:hypothetical protein
MPPPPPAMVPTLVMVRSALARSAGPPGFPSTRLASRTAPGLQAPWWFPEPPAPPAPAMRPKLTSVSVEPAGMTPVSKAGTRVEVEVEVRATPASMVTRTFTVPPSQK